MFFELYNRLIQGIDSDFSVSGTLCGQCWTAVETRNSFGIAMTTPADTAPRMFTGEYTGMSLKRLAEASKSWNLAVVEDVIPSGLGNEVDLEQLLLWNPDVIIFAPDSCYETIAGAAQWESLGAVATGNYFRTPDGPYGWLSSPPAVQRYLGMLWLGALLYPDYIEYDLQEKITEYYQLFYGCTLTDEMYQSLTENALP